MLGPSSLPLKSAYQNISEYDLSLNFIWWQLYCLELVVFANSLHLLCPISALNFIMEGGGDCAKAIAIQAPSLPVRKLWPSYSSGQMEPSMPQCFSQINTQTLLIQDVGLQYSKSTYFLQSNEGCYTATLTVIVYITEVQSWEAIFLIISNDYSKIMPSALEIECQELLGFLQH